MITLLEDFNSLEFDPLDKAAEAFMDGEYEFSDVCDVFGVDEHTLAQHLMQHHGVDAYADYEEDEKPERVTNHGDSIMDSENKILSMRSIIDRI